jgi:hypothetical protein
LLSFDCSHLPFLQTNVQGILDQSGVREFKWSKLRTAKNRFCALKLCEFTVDHARRGQLRIDVLTWDIGDSRHKVERRDDVANLQRMYYHLFRNVLRKRWPSDGMWRLCPDENTAVDWDTVEDFLSGASTELEVGGDLLTHGKFRVRLKTEFGIDTIAPCDSAEQPLVGVADLCTGLGIYSRSCYDRYEQWHAKHGPQPRLFPVNEHSRLLLSGADRERCQVLSSFAQMCKKYRLGVSLRSKRGLRTYNPSNPINYWWYEPQHELDKAPVRAKRR